VSAVGNPRHSRYSRAVRATVLKRLVCVAVLWLGASAVPAPARAEPVVERTFWALLPLTPAQAREVAGLLQAPGVVLHEVADGGGAVLHVLPGLPNALVHDVVTMPSRHLALLHGVITDVLELDRAAREGGLFRHTVRALHRAKTISAAAGVVDRLLQPKNRTTRLAIVLTARYHGVPLEDPDLDAVRRAIDRDTPDVGPLLARAIERLAQAYGRDALHVLLFR
jgi:hypothetical protein